MYPFNNWPNSHMSFQIQPSIHQATISQQFVSIYPQQSLSQQPQFVDHVVGKENIKI